MKIEKLSNSPEESPKAMDKTDNEIIAEFMGLHFDESGQCTDPERKYSWRPGVYDPLKVEHLQYDTSWAWLMLVVEKIEITIRDTKWIKGAWSITDLPITTKKEEVYKYAMDFIKWFNSQNNGQ